MRDIAKEAYEACPIGGTGWMRLDATRGETLATFQAVAEVSAPAMQEAGIIFIQEMHRESQTGNRMVDAIKFMRVR